MKKFLMMAVVALVAVSAYATEIPLTWSIDWYVGMMYSPDDPTGNDPIMASYSITWDLCWSDSADKSDAVILGTREFASGFTSYVDDQNPTFYGSEKSRPVYDDYMMAIGSNQGTVNFAVEGTGTTSPGYLWQRIVATSADPDGTDYIWEGDAWQISAITDNMITPSSLDGYDAAVGDPTGKALWSPIPEPATMSLLGLGALAMVLRRKLRK